MEPTDTETTSGAHGAAGELTGVVTLSIGSEKICCPRQVLQEASLYFQGMFNSRMVESKAETVHIKEVSASVFATLVEHAKTGELSLGMDNVCDVLAAAARFQFTKAVEACETYMCAELTSDNCLAVKTMAFQCGLKKLELKARVHSVFNFQEVTESEEFLGLSAEFVKEYLGDQMLNVDSEMQVFNALLKWLSFDPAKRLVDSVDMFSVVDLSCLSTDELEQVAGCSQVQRQGNAEFLALVQDAIAARSSARETNQKACQRGVPHVPWILGGEGHVSTMREFCQETGEFTTVGYLPEPLQMKELLGHAVCVIGTDLYLLGGERLLGRGNWQSDVWKYDGLEQQWSVMCQMPNRCRHLTAVAWGRHIYVIGGVDRFRIKLSTVLRLDTHTGKWDQIPPLLHPVFSSKACVCNGKLYVIQLNVQVYTPGDASWSELELPPEDYCHLVKPARICSWAGKIFLLGESGGSAFEFDPSTGTTVELEPLGVDGLYSITVHKDKLCVFGDGEEPHTPIVFTSYDLSKRRLLETVKLCQRMCFNHRAVSMARLSHLTS